MGMYIVRGGRAITGEVRVRGSKNAALPILAACLLTEDEVILENCPLIQDVRQTLDILRELGCSVTVSEADRTVLVDSRHINCVEIRKETMEKMRSSILFMGALLGRAKKARLAYPGGCAIGKRPIDFHLNAFEKMGVVIREEGGILDCAAPHILGYHLYLPLPSVGATENILLLAARAEGVTVIHNAAREPEVIALARFLRACGAEIYGEGTSSILIEGVKKLHGAYAAIPADRIEGGTLLCMAAMTNGKLWLQGLEREQMGAVLEVLERTGCQCSWEKSGNLFLQPPKRLQSDFSLTTGPFPAFPTDLQPLMMSLLTLAKGTCMINETVFEARFSHAEELCRMGAKIAVCGQEARVFGVETLYGAEVFGKDLRGTAALLAAALAAEGESHVHGREFLERGYETIEDIVSLLGGDIQTPEERKTVVEARDTGEQTKQQTKQQTEQKTIEGIYQEAAEETLEAAGRSF